MRERFVSVCVSPFSPPTEISMGSVAISPRWHFFFLGSFSCFFETLVRMSFPTENSDKNPENSW